MYDNLGKYFASSKSTEIPTKSLEEGDTDVESDVESDVVSDVESDVESDENFEYSSSVTTQATSSVTSQATDSDYCKAPAGPGEIIFLY